LRGRTGVSGMAERRIGSRRRMDVTMEMLEDEGKQMRNKLTALHLNTSFPTPIRLATPPNTPVANTPSSKPVAIDVPESAQKIPPDKSRSGGVPTFPNTYPSPTISSHPQSIPLVTKRVPQSQQAPRPSTSTYGHPKRSNHWQ